MKTKVNYLKIIMIFCMVVCILTNITGMTAYAATNEIEQEQSLVEMNDIEVEDLQNTGEEELIPQAARACDPLAYYFGRDYVITGVNGPWQYISGSGLTGRFNTSTGVGYIYFEDGIEEFHI